MFLQKTSLDIEHVNEIATNVLGVYSQDMQFIYVLPSWEGSTADGRVLRDAISRINGVVVPRDDENELEDEEGGKHEEVEESVTTIEPSEEWTILSKGYLILGEHKEV
ncbi:hypothetical protein BUALT_Bualt01G0134800 [Buddleja alternifolia]|uniref:Uncharacterized protein n=1 Tax=Buddleja alternifolia TaxID=168488 RepID=A0AAV6YHN5_9LAMI|nr:hypothetical protein BUALT_Bualt01G0134800 [Buddleja alternifolia]